MLLTQPVGRHDYEALVHRERPVGLVFSGHWQWTWDRRGRCELRCGAVPREKGRWEYIERKL